MGQPSSAITQTPRNYGTLSSQVSPEEVRAQIEKAKRAHQETMHSTIRQLAVLEFQGEGAHNYQTNKEEEIEEETQLIRSNQNLKEFPSDIFTLFQHIIYLDLSHNELKEISPQLGELKLLNTLRLDHNQIEEIPDALTSLKDLTILSLNNNALTRLPETLTKLENLEQLFLAHNQLQTLPDSFIHFEKLYLLDLCDNQFANIPTVAHKIISLFILKFSNNPLEPTLELPQGKESRGKLAIIHFFNHQNSDSEDSDEEVWQRGEKRRGEEIPLQSQSSQKKIKCTLREPTSGDPDS